MHPKASKSIQKHLNPRPPPPSSRRGGDLRYKQLSAFFGVSGSFFLHFLDPFWSIILFPFPFVFVFDSLVFVFLDFVLFLFSFCFFVSLFCSFAFCFCVHAFLLFCIWFRNPVFRFLFAESCLDFCFGVLSGFVFVFLFEVPVYGMAHLGLLCIHCGIAGT